MNSQLSSRQSTSFTASSMLSFDASQRFNGMLDVSLYKRIRNNLSQLVDYVAMTSSPFIAMHTVITIMRILQFIGPIIGARLFELWGVGTLMYWVNTVLSVAFTFYPQTLMDGVEIYILFIFSAIFLIFSITILISSYYYNKEAKLPKLMSPLITIFMGTIGFVFPPIAGYCSAILIGKMISKKIQFDVIYIVAIVLSIISLGLFVWFFSVIYSVTIKFTPQSLMTTMPYVQVQLNFMMLFLYFLSGMTGELPLIAKVIFVNIQSILYFTIIPVINQYGGLVKNLEKKILVTTSITGGVLMPICSVFIAKNIPATEMIIILLGATWVIVFFIVQYFIGRGTQKRLSIIDMIEDDVDNFDLIKNPSHFSNVVIEGFRYAHTQCLNWSLFKQAAALWPMNVKIWFLFAKFTAIYPESTQQLDWISSTMLQNHLKGTVAKQTVSQIQSVTRLREINLIPAMKQRIDKSAKQVQSCKHLVRHIWDLIIQSNIHEMEGAVMRAGAQIENTEADFQHLLRMFPNSRFVARAYARFLKEVVADYSGYQQWMQNTAALQRGQAIIEDQAHEYGLWAFPLLPKTLSDDGISAQGLINDDTLTQEIEPEDDQNNLDIELRSNILDSIRNLSIPAYKKAKHIRLWLFVILFLIPTITLCVLIPIIVTDTTTPLKFLHEMSRLRSILLHILAFSYHYILEETVNMKGLDLYDGEKPPISIGGSVKTKVQLQVMCEKLSDIADQSSMIGNFQPGNKYMQKVRHILFDESFLYKQFKQNGDIVEKKISIRGCLMNYVVLMQNILKLEVVTLDVLTSETILTIFNNCMAIVDEIDEIMDLINQYIDEANTFIDYVLLIVMSVLCTIIIILQIFSAYYINKRISVEKMIIYKSIASLPKNVISRVSDSFKVLKKNSDMTKTSQIADEEISKQEENVLKIFTTSLSDSGSQTSDAVIIWLTTISVLALNVFTIIFLALMLSISTTEIAETSPHIKFIMDSYSNDIAAVFMLNILAGQNAGANVPGYTSERVIKRAYEFHQKSKKAYNNVRYGDPSRDLKPLSILPLEFLHGSVNSDCPKNWDDVIPTEPHDLYRCWFPDMLLPIVQQEVMEYLSLAKNGLRFDVQDIRLYRVWHIYFMHIFEDYYFPIFGSIVKILTDSIYSKLPERIGSAMGALVAAIILEIFILIILIKSEERQKFALKILLHCPGGVVLANSNLSQIFAGNFSNKTIDSTLRNAAFYDKLVLDLPDAVITTDLSGNIITANNAAERTFEMSFSEHVGTNIKTFGSKFEKNPFPFNENRKTVTDEDNFEKLVVYKRSSDEIHVHIEFTVLNDGCIIAMRDDTQTVMYNKLIADERGKSDKMLQSILPPRLVPRVQAGEKNISFAVQSVSVLFMDVVSFTPWCGSTPAERVMATLNAFFKRLDHLVSIHPTMTKIKCIGDCYMAAAGIFADTNQPAIHAKDIIEFGLEAIEALIKLDEEINEKLQIRVGINTGGPVVAGVLGTEKPTFEIIGPTINMAQQMEHHGVPMKVHISRAVYELVYGDKFIIKERGEIEVKNGKALTYLVEGKR